MADLAPNDTSAPTRKTIAGAVGGTLAGAVVTVGDWIFTTTTHLEIPVAVDAAFIVIVSAAFSYFAREWA